MLRPELSLKCGSKRLSNIREVESKMVEAEIKFEREGREGLVAIGTYLIDVAKRFGIHFDDVCSPETGLHYCSVVIKSGSGLLSEMTRAE